MPPKFPLQNLNTTPVSKKQKENISHEQELQNAYVEFLKEVEDGRGVPSVALEPLEQALKEAKKHTVNTEKIEKELPALTKKLWKNYVSMWVERIEKGEVYNNEDITLSIDLSSGIQDLEDALTEMPKELFDEEMIETFRTTFERIGTILYEAGQKKKDVETAQSDYEELLELVKTKGIPRLNPHKE